MCLPTSVCSVKTKNCSFLVQTILKWVIPSTEPAHLPLRHHFFSQAWFSLFSKESKSVTEWIEPRGPLCRSFLLFGFAAIICFFFLVLVNSSCFPLEACCLYLKHSTVMQSLSRKDRSHNIVGRLVCLTDKPVGFVCVSACVFLQWLHIENWHSAIQMRTFWLAFTTWKDYLKIRTSRLELG